MLQTYFKLAYRNIIKDKAYSILNITGLAIGLASSILILLWVQNELSYDKFHKNANQIYRIACDLGELLERRGRRHEIEDLVASVFDTFDQGRATLDLERAGAWLAHSQIRAQH